MKLSELIKSFDLEIIERIKELVLAIHNIEWLENESEIVPSKDGDIGDIMVLVHAYEETFILIKGFSPEWWSVHQGSDSYILHVLDCFPYLIDSVWRNDFLKALDSECDYFAVLNKHVSADGIDYINEGGERYGIDKIVIIDENLVHFFEDGDACIYKIKDIIENCQELLYFTKEGEEDLLKYIERH